MTYYTPADFAARYHAIPIMDSRLGITTTIDLQNYWNGWSPERNTEYWRLLSLLAAKLKLKSGAAVVAQSQPFYITGFPDQVNPAEEWYVASLRRAYEGRGSPDEIADAVRLAVFCGLNKKPALTPDAYCTKWFGLDCNTFVGNWLGISPSSAIFAYAQGYGKGESLPGATGDVYTTRSRLPLAPITDPALLEQGNVVCTYGAADGRGFKWRHIALVQDIQPQGGDKYSIWLAEWGTKGNIEKHRTPLPTPRTVTITAGASAPELRSKELLAFDGTTPDGKPAKRIFFDHHSLDDIPHRGWHVGGLYGT
ncbi:hypothetical protein [Muricoccus radiodurans]|uniref:hypothetical protein n=1 Tax=Muricoccus radiodurans TaxID=2231721 RepID=UPI003CF3B5D9